MAKQDYSRFTFTSEKDPSSGGYGKLIDQQHDIRLIERAVKASLPEDAFYKIVKRAQSKSGKTTIDVYVHQDQSAVAKKGITEAEKELVFKGSVDKKYKVVKARSVSTDTVKQLSHEEKLSEKEKERKEDRKENAGFRLLSSRVSKIIGVLVLITDIVRRILSATLQNAVQTSKDMVIAHNLGISYRQAREAGFVEKAHGLEAGTITGAVSGIQTAFGNITTLDEKSLEALAVVMGSQIKDMALAGVGASDPMKMLESIVNAFNAQANAGLNSIGRYVGQEQARKELYTYLKKFMPEVADIFAKMQEEQHNVNSVFRDVKDFGTFWSSANPNRGEIQGYEFNVVATTGQLENKLQTVIDQMKSGVLVALAPWVTSLLRRLADVRWGMSASENDERNRQNLAENKAYINELRQAKKAIESKGNLTREDKIYLSELDYEIARVEKANEQYEKKRKNVAPMRRSVSEIQYEVAQAHADLILDDVLTGKKQDYDNWNTGYVPDEEVLDIMRTAVENRLSPEQIAKGKEDLTNDLYTFYSYDRLKGKKKEYDTLMKRYHSDYLEGVKNKTINPKDYAYTWERYAWERINQQQQENPTMSELVTIETDKKGNKRYVTHEKELTAHDEQLMKQQIGENLPDEKLYPYLIQLYGASLSDYVEEYARNKQSSSVGASLTAFLTQAGVDWDKSLYGKNIDEVQGKSLIGYMDSSSGEAKYVIVLDVKGDGVTKDDIVLWSQTGFEGYQGKLGEAYVTAQTRNGKVADVNIQGAGDGASTLAK